MPLFFAKYIIRSVLFDLIFVIVSRGSRKCGGTGAALLGNGRYQVEEMMLVGKNKNKEENKKRNREKRKKKKIKRAGREEEKERRRGQNILANYGVRMTNIRKRKKIL